MKLAFATIVLVPRGTWGAAPTRDQRRGVFAWAARAGFAGVELSARWLPVHRLAEPELEALRSDVAEAGLVTAGLSVSRCLFTRTDRAAESWATIERVVEAAPVLGAPVVNVALAMPTLPTRERPRLRGQDVPDDEQVRIADGVGRLARRAAAAGTSIAVELHDDGPLDSAPLLRELLGRVGEPNVGVNPDLGNACRNPEDRADWEGTLRVLAPQALCWHVKNYRGAEAVPLDEGDIDYRGAVAIMRRAGFCGWVSIESYFGDVLALQTRGRAYLLSLLSPTNDQKQGRAAWPETAKS